MLLGVLTPAQSMAKMSSKALNTVHLDNEYEMGIFKATSSPFGQPQSVIVGRSNLVLFVSCTSEMVAIGEHISGVSLPDCNYLLGPSQFHDSSTSSRTEEPNHHSRAIRGTSLPSHATFFSSHCCQSSLEKLLEMPPSTIPCEEVSICL